MYKSALKDPLVIIIGSQKIATSTSTCKFIIAATNRIYIYIYIYITAQSSVLSIGLHLQHLVKDEYQY